MLFASQGMTRVDQGHAEQAGEARTDITCIGVMAVNDVRYPPYATHMLQGPINKTRQVGPQHFLAQIPSWTTVETDQIRLVTELLFGLCIVRADFGVDDTPRE